MMRNPLKELFTFTKSERQGVFVLLLIIALLLLANILMPFFFQNKEHSEYAQFVKEIEAFEKQFQNDSLKSKPAYNNKRNIISEENLFVLENDKTNNNAIRYVKKDYNNKPYTKKEYTPKRLNININTADTTELVQLRGIGNTFANRIVKYREKLGGFFEAEQLLEVYGFDSLKYELVKNEIYIDENALRRLNINSAEIKEMIKHPYIDYKLAAAISKQRFKKKFESVDELKTVYLVNDSLFRKLAPYFSTE